MIYLANAFSANMLDLTVEQKTNFKPLTAEQASDLARDAKSVIGHSDTASLVSKAFGYKVEFNRQSVSLQSEDKVILAQYSGPRLPEGATALPEGATITYSLVTVE